MKITDYYKTSDLGLAATISMSYPIDLIDKTNPRRAVFVFVREEGIDQCIEGYWSGELKVSPREYFSQIKYLKSRLYEEEGRV